jgi:hypothetical protein
MASLFLALLLAVGFFLGQAHAGNVTLAWDANNPTPDGYNLYQRAEGQPYDYTKPVNKEPITGTSYTVTDLEPGHYFFVVRAFVGSEESGDSNEAVYVVPEPEQISHLSLNLLHPDGAQVEVIRPGTYIFEGFPFVVEVRIPAEDNDEPAYSTNKDRTIYHRRSCRHYRKEFGIHSPEDCPTCRSCKICKP